MRTTITLDEDVAAQLERVMRERDVTCKSAVNEALRDGLGIDREARAYRLPTYAMGARTGIDLDKALSLAGSLEESDR